MAQTHWKKLHNPDYIGAYALEPGKDMILTIKSVTKEQVTGADGKNEECMIIRFSDYPKPMICNSTNAKSIEKTYKSPFIEDWAGRKIQLYAKQIRAFGENVEALRIREFVPKVEQKQKNPDCADCKKPIKTVQGATPQQIADHTYKKYGKSLCADCANKLAEKQQKTTDPLAAKKDGE